MHDFSKARVWGFGVITDTAGEIWSWGWDIVVKSLNRGRVMGDDKSAMVMALASRDSRDRELLIPVADASVVDHDDDASSKPSSSSSSSSSSSASSSHHSGREGCVILFPIALGINIFGLGFVTSITFIFLIGVFMSSWLGASVLGLGEWFIKRMPFVRLIYSASKQISAAISPGQNTQAFKEVAIIRHPRIGEYAFGFITSSLVLQFLNNGILDLGVACKLYMIIFGYICDYCSTKGSDEELCCVYVPTNHLYIGDILLVNAKDVIRPNLSVREGIGKNSSLKVVNTSFNLLPYMTLELYYVTWTSCFPQSAVSGKYDKGKLSCLGACQCHGSCRRCIQQLFKWIELDPTEVENQDGSRCS
ncbi:unnamed protein product [Camellia sinensis]